MVGSHSAPVSLECDSEIDEEALDEAWLKTHCNKCSASFPHYGRTGSIGYKHRHKECKSYRVMDLCWNCFWFEHNEPKRGAHRLFPDCVECDAITLEKIRDSARNEMSEIAVLLLGTKFCTFQ